MLAGLAGAAVSGIPSTVVTLARGGDVLEGPPQWLDHAAYGLAVGTTLRLRRR